MKARQVSSKLIDSITYKNRHFKIWLGTCQNDIKALPFQSSYRIQQIYFYEMNETAAFRLQTAINYQYKIGNLIV